MRAINTSICLMLQWLNLLGNLFIEQYQVATALLLSYFSKWMFDSACITETFSQLCRQVVCLYDGILLFVACLALNTTCTPNVIFMENSYGNFSLQKGNHQQMMGTEWDQQCQHHPACTWIIITVVVSIPYLYIEAWVVPVKFSLCFQTYTIDNVFKVYCFDMFVRTIHWWAILHSGNDLSSSMQSTYYSRVVRSCYCF